MRLRHCMPTPTTRISCRRSATAPRQEAAEGEEEAEAAWGQGQLLATAPHQAEEEGEEEEVWGQGG